MNDSRFLLHSSASGKFAHFDRLHRRAGAGTTTGQPGCNKGAKQFVFMGTAADCNYVNSYGGTANALKQILSDFNQASAVYESSFNVGLAIIKVDLRSQCQSGMDATSGFNVNWNSVCSDKYSISQRLSDFSQWRGTKDGSTPDNAGLWHLMTGCTTAVSGQAVGIAWLQTLCLQTTNGQSDQGSVTGSDFVSGTAVSSIVTVEWKVVAHEVGHNFGAHHDCTASTCPADSSVCCPCSPTCDCAGQFLMHPTDNAITSQFSPCSVKDICATLQDPNRYGCLKPPNALQALTTNICGNGVKEGNEECDCGGKDCGQTDPCCDGATCKLTAGSVCDDKNDDCCSQCQFRAQGFVCRPSTGICDYAEVCTGKNGTCPPNLFAPNGQTCGNNGTVCASGICTSRDDQCRSSAYSITTSGVCPGTATQCQLLCQGPGGQCYQLAGNMIDGTPCGYAGSCVQGSCQENGWFAQAIDLFMANLQISIPIAIAVGFLILSLIWSMCGCCYRQYKYGSAKKQPRRPRPHDLPVVVPTAGIPLAYTQYGASASAAGAGGYGSYQQHQHPAGGAAASYGTPAYQVRPGSETANARPGQTPVFIPSEERRGGAEMDTSSQSHWVDPARYNGVS
ncbi:Metallo-peptidase family M12B Reprolysin-like-domain-containing protein [Chytriomyces sp. MP71]|nr:Metallo-peptidase family M12B Reprolysin-like-domain-containing protein [Chytriomyces sp. MP71]